MHTYYIKNRNVTQMEIPCQASWVIRKIWNASKYLVQYCGELSVLYHNHFSISALYKQMRGSFDKVPWRRMSCNNHAPPKFLFIVWLALLGRLSTCENLLKIGIQCDPQCCLCESGVDSLQHLFFSCPYSSTVWGELLQWLQIRRDPCYWDSEVHMVVQHFHSCSVQHQIYRIALAVVVYLLWRERNHRKFQNLRMDPQALVAQAKLWVCIRCFHVRKLARCSFLY